MSDKLFRQTRIMDWLAALFLFVLLREWLLPLPALTDTADLTSFYYILIGVLLLDMLLAWRWVTFLLKVGGLLWLLHHHFFVTPFFDTEWLAEVYVRLQHDLPLAFQQNWFDMSPVSRNALFFLLLVILTSLLSYLVLEQRQGLWFVFMTELYLATLDTFMPYEADGAIVRSLIAGFLLLAVIHLSSLEKWNSAKGRYRLSYWNSLIAPMIIVSLTVGVAFAAPKKAASWPDPVAFLTGEQTGGNVYLKKVGYDNNDNRLGGPFMQDNALVFTAVTNEKTYWRGDSKDIYTGWGWEKGDRSHVAILDPQTYRWNDTLYSTEETKEVKATLEFHAEQFPTVFYPGQLQRLTDYSPTNATLVYDQEHEQVEVRDGKIQLVTTSNMPGADQQQIYMVPNTILMKLDSYSLEAEVPILSEKKLVSLGNDYPEEIKQKYLQLPETLPPRVRELALSVTKDASTPYEKVRAVEDFLRNSGQYDYETEDVPVPEKGQDFVDQFLFESFRGYCDHFSTSMAVMLRSIGIPTRWVKGFATGTDAGEDENGNELIEVRNKDAHSWVEVYFPELGWVPFEPTSSFISPVRINYDLFTQTQTQTALPDRGDSGPIDRGDGRLEELEEDQESSSGGFSLSWKWVALFLAAGIAGAGAIWMRRQQLFVWWLHRKLSTYQEDQFADRYKVLLSLFEQVFATRREGETLREYVNRLTISGDKRQDLFYLTQLFERILYGYKGIEGKAKDVANKLIDQLSQQLKP